MGTSRGRGHAVQAATAREGIGEIDRSIEAVRVVAARATVSR